MASLQTQYFFPHFPPSPSPTATPPPPHFLPSHPPPHTIPSPPPHAIPPPPHVVPPPPSPPPPPPQSAPGNHTTIIVVVFVSCGVSFLAFVMAALWCFLKKKKKMARKDKNVHIDEHRKVAESIVTGPYGTETVVLSVEDDVNIEEDIRKSEVKNFRKGLHLNSGEHKHIAGLVDAGEPSSSSDHHHHQNPEIDILKFPWRNSREIGEMN